VKLPTLSLATQVLLGITTLFVMILVTTSLLSAWNLDRQLTSQFESKGLAIANSIANSSIDEMLSGDGSALQAMIDGFLEINGVGYVFVVDGDSAVVGHTFAPAMPDVLKEGRKDKAISTQANTISTLEIPGMGTYVDVTAPILAGVAGTVHVGMARSFIANQVRDAVLVQNLSILALFAVSLVLAYAHINRVAKPLRVLTAHARTVASADHLERLAADETVKEANAGGGSTSMWAAAEVSALSIAFQNMERELLKYISNLSRARADLEEHNRTLEHRVAERTRELVTKNQEIESALARLQTAQEQIVASEKLASLGALTAGIAHEIKNPLNFVNNFAELSAELTAELAAAVGTHVTGAAAEDLTDIIGMLQMNVQKINEHGKRADSIVRNMLLHSRKGNSERSDIDLNALLLESLNLAYHGMRGQDTSFNARLETHFDPAVKTIAAMPQELSRAFLNIMTNAFYALRDKSRRLGEGFDPVLTVSSKSLGDTVEIRIRDNGTGIPDDVKAKMFEPFFTTKPAGQGTGLGLSMTFDILVQAHRGSVTVDTVPGEFAEFVITLPIAGRGGPA
jgi:signal transduction histidine kinase